MIKKYTVFIVSPLPQKEDLKWNKSNEKCSNVPQYLAEIAEVVESDPDPYFNGVRKVTNLNSCLNCNYCNDFLCRHTIGTTLEVL